MPRTADCDPIEALRHSASYLRELRDRFGNLGLAAAAYNAGPSRVASLIGDREPIVLHKQIPGMGRAKRYIITIADDNRAPSTKLCEKLIAAGSTCDALRNAFGQD